ncbi:MAG: hypothetical protein M9916_06015 [Crocinitomicaceae bacterium]|nr:hypothetical protein [Crocinitomicaceae bacterium]
MNQEINISNQSADSGFSYSIIKTKEELVNRKIVLSNKRIGISISESENLKELGYDLPHLKDVIIETARYILSLGGSLAYGGDMRNGGFTELFFDLLNHYKLSDHDKPSERFYSFLSWPLSLELSKQQQSDLINHVTFKKVSPPSDINIENKEEFLIPQGVPNLYIWTRCLTEMRQQMETTCDARIFIGGRSKGFKGKYPGLLEELLIAIDYKHPVYLVGSFGGIVNTIIDVLNDGNTADLSNDFYKSDTNYQELISYYNSQNTDSSIDYDVTKKQIQELGWKGISEQNGLTISENKRLATTPHINEIVYLILKGLTNIFSNK